MLEGKSEKLEFQEMLSSPHWKRNEQEQNKNAEKGTKRIGESKKKDMNKKTMKKWSLVKIILKHSLGLLILSFGTPNPGLHYVPKKSILIERKYLDWRSFFFERFL